MKRIPALKLKWIWIVIAPILLLILIKTLHWKQDQTTPNPTTIETKSQSPQPPAQKPPLKPVQLNSNVISYIEKNFGKDPKKKKAAMQAARSEQLIIDRSESPDSILSAGIRANLCLGLVFGSSAIDQINHNLRELTFDNSDKMDSLLSWNQEWHGKFIPLSKTDPSNICDP